MPEKSDIKNIFFKLVYLYKSQVSMSHRTSESVRLQQYSTPNFLGYIMGIYTLASNLAIKNTLPDDALMIDTSAGNGMLTIAFKPNNCIVNEIDPIRLKNLKSQGFKKVLNQDATLPFNEYKNSIPCIVINPPFGTIDEPVKYDNFEVKSLEMLMALRAIDTMKDSGKAAIIVGGHQEWDEQGRIKSGKNRLFFVYLYARYFVEDVINISGRDLYSRMGTAFNVRIILVNGRKSEVGGLPPLLNKKLGVTDINSGEIVTTFEDLYTRIIKSM